MRDKSITIFGGSGFLGRYVVQKLAKTGARIRVAVRHPSDALFLKTMGEIGQITPVAVNVRDQDSVAQAIKGAYGVINLIGILAETSKQSFQQAHVDAASIIAKVSKALDVKKLIHISAIGADPNAESIYAATKGKGEAEVLKHFPTVSIIRPSVVFGDEDKFLNLFASMTRFSPFLPAIGGGKTKLQPVYVGDVAEAVVKIMTDRRIDKSPYAGKTFELGGVKVYSMRDILKFIMTEVNRKRFLLDIPFSVAGVGGAVLQYLPGPLLTPDQVKLLKKDNIVGEKALTFKELDISPCSMELLAPVYLKRYRYGG